MSSADMIRSAEVQVPAAAGSTVQFTTGADSASLIEALAPIFLTRPRSTMLLFQ
jgi:hypothetical protein